jgi:hypothetical protein
MNGLAKSGLKEYGGLRLMENDVCKYRIMKGNPQIKSEVRGVRPLWMNIIVNTQLQVVLLLDLHHQFDECRDYQ